jgi:beta-1,4-N-acetylglucosaminyltransferase
MPSSRAPTSLFVTVGSTLFPSLTDIVLSATSLDALVSLGIQTLEVQYGKADLPLHVIAPAPSGKSSEAVQDDVGGGDRGGGRDTAIELEVDSSGSGRFTWKAGQIGDGSGESQGRKMEVVMYRYTDDFEGAIRRCGAVISHAGELGYNMGWPSVSKCLRYMPAHGLSPPPSSISRSTSGQ